MLPERSDAQSYVDDLVYRYDHAPQNLWGTTVSSVEELAQYFPATSKSKAPIRHSAEGFGNCLGIYVIQHLNASGKIVAASPVAVGHEGPDGCHKIVIGPPVAHAIDLDAYPTAGYHGVTVYCRHCDKQVDEIPFEIS
jgi:hypothetical protein